MNSNTNTNQYKCHIVWQQIIAIDVKYNVFRNPNIKILYIKRRNQILRERSKRELNSYRKQYLKLRSQLLSQKYGISCDQSGRNRYVRSNSNSRLASEDSMDSRSGRPLWSAIQSDPFYDRLIPNYGLDLSRHNVVNAFSENYSFSGMHHIFDQHKEAVTSIRFANDDKSLLCCSSMDSTLSICQLTPSPATILYVLRGHKAGVVDFEWSLSNDLIVSCSLDSTVKLWGAASGYCLRTIDDPYACPVMACVFHPYNNNMVVAANAKGCLQVLNVSTGIYTKRVAFDGDEHNSILCLCFDTTGHTLWVGDSKGFISSFIFEMRSCRLVLVNKVIVVAGCAITSISNRCVSGLVNSEPLLLVNSACNALLLFKVIPREANLEIIQSFSIKHQNKDLIIRSSFCPIISNREGVCVVTGCEDTCVYFFTVEENKYCKSKCVNKLQGHSAPVLDVCFNYDESLLASSDSKGNVIIWKRESY
ncbi:unnamed protein product [Medioppia subpectinata]|uniref:WD repeat-containing protein 13 n=1 Tax=Medioppia subpectinata TaxID=1979941 RepID=A0A7R9KSC1_9ACAR|nr:unnamed protein product [Medioppia subpectinata]CAG2108873.1 unnamed protein product [Medioppia subpectinata]